jgi:hypothetical protein
MNLTEKEISYLIQGLNEYKLVIGLAKSKQRNRLKIRFNLNLKNKIKVSNELTKEIA